MKQIIGLLLFYIGAGTQFSHAQARLDSLKFFTDEGVIDMTLTTDIRKLQNEKGLDVFQNATVTCRFPDSTVIEEPITIAARGHFRREYCNIPPIMIDFSNASSPKLSPLGKLKLVIGCGVTGNDEQLLIKEWLAYKIYNLLEEKSFRVRLVRVSYRDSRTKVRAFSQYAFLIEDDKDLAARNNCIKIPNVTYLTEGTDRALMTKVAVFEYLISNGDWSVPHNHNIRLIFEKNNSAALPYPVPYDFDHSGFVNANYAAPNELLGTESVTQRVYRGFPRTMDELQITLEVFRAKKEAIFALVNNCTYLLPRDKKEIVNFINEFYKTINDRKQVQYYFIDKARVE